MFGNCYLLAAVALGLISASRPALSQTSPVFTQSADSTPVTIVLVDRWEFADASAVIVRRATVEPHDVIELRRNGADFDRLTTAVALLMLKRTQDGFVPAEDSRTVLGRYKVPSNWRDRGVPRFAGVLAALSRSQEREVPGIGRAQAIDVQLPKVSVRLGRPPAP